MIRSVKLLWAIGWHYVKGTPGRKKYSVKDRDLDITTKKAYRKEIFTMLQRLGADMIKAADTEIIVTGEENLPLEGPVVYMSNHRGMYDNPILANLLKEPTVFIGKIEVKKIPIFSSWFEALGCIYMARGDVKESGKAILAAIQELKNGQSILVFPEGTRSKEEDILPFKAGSFKLATKSNVPIVPIAIEGTQKILEEKGTIQKATVYVSIGKPVEVASLTAEEKKELPAKVEGMVRAMREEILQKQA